MLLNELVTVESGLLTTRIPEGNDEVKFLTNTSFNSTCISESFEIKKCNEEKVKKYFLKKGDIIIRNVDPFKPLYINEDNVVMTNFAFKLSVKNNAISGEDLLELLCTSDFRSHIKREVKGTGILRISKRELENYEVKEFNQQINEFKFKTRKLINLKRKEIDLCNLIINGDYTNTLKRGKNE